jgi:hypothetical protein
MRRIAGVAEMQMRFAVYSQAEGNRARRPKRVQPFAEWVGSSEPSATTYIRRVQLDGAIETATNYKGRFQFRWLDASGKVIAKANRWTRNCHQKTGLPDGTITKVEHFPGAPATFARPGDTTTYVVTLENKGASSATNLGYVTLRAGGVEANPEPQSTLLIFDYLLPKSTIKLTFSGPDCAAPLIVAYDPAANVRERNENNNGGNFRC